MYQSHVKKAAFYSLLIHAGIVLLLSNVWWDMLPEPQQPMRVQLVSLPAPKKVDDKPKPKPQPTKPKVEQIKTQASAAPKEAPKETKKAVTKKETKAPKVKVAETTKKKKEPKPAPKKEAPKIEKEEKVEAKRRPPKLDKTPDKKKAIRSEDETAKTVADPDDFLAALDFVDDLKKNRPEPKAEEKPVEPEEELELTFAEQLDADQHIAAIQKHIHGNWEIPPGLKGVEELSTLIEIKVDADGSLRSINVTKPSGEPFYDQAAIRAVRKAVPLPMPTDGRILRKLSEIEINFTPAI